MKLAFGSVISRTSACSHSHLPTPHTPAQTFFVFENFSPAPLHHSSFSKVAQQTLCSPSSRTHTDPCAGLLPAHTQSQITLPAPHTLLVQSPQTPKPLSARNPNLNPSRHSQFPNFIT